MELTRPEAADDRFFREVLGRYPTGVVAITACAAGGEPIGMLVGSFTSVSIDPPLVSYLPARTSSSYAELRAGTRFCVNVLSDRQEDVCRAFATRKGEEKFAGVAWTPSPLGSPMLDGALAWIDCVVESEIEAGDHYIVVGRVEGLEVANPGLPLIFHQGGYGSFQPRSRVIPSTVDLVEQLALVDTARPFIEALADDLDMECAVMSREGDWVVRLASAGTPALGASPIQVGQRLPFNAPLGALFVAWEASDVRERWIDRGAGTDDPQVRAAHLAGLDLVRERRWLLSLLTPAYRELDRILVELPDGPEKIARLRELEPALGGPSAYDPGELDPAGRYDVRNASVPLLGPDGRPLLYFSVFGFAEQMAGADVLTVLDALRDTVDAIGAALA